MLQLNATRESKKEETKAKLEKEENYVLNIFEVSIWTTIRIFISYAKLYIHIIILTLLNDLSV